MTAAAAPRVSVLLPVYNAEKFLERTLRSLAEQTFADFEIVAIDDGSTDGSLAVLQAFSDPRLRIERNPRNLGIIGTLNRGLTLCRGDYVARMDADDVCLPERFEAQVRYLDANPRCVMVGTGRIGIDEEERPVASFNRPATGPEIIRWKLLTGNFITHPTVMMRRSLLPVPLFFDRYRHAEDYAAWLLLLRHGEIEILPERLLKYRFHSQSVSHRNKMPQVEAAMAALADHLREAYDGASFDFRALALWSAPQDAAQFEKSPDFLRLLRWMNPLRRTFRSRLGARDLLLAFGHYHRRLLLLLISHRRRMELALPVLWAMVTSPFPARG